MWSFFFSLSLSLSLFSLQGMVDPGDTVSATLKKEFGEEAMNSLEASEEEKKVIEAHINTLFSGGEQVSLRKWLRRSESEEVVFSVTTLLLLMFFLHIKDHFNSPTYASLLSPKIFVTISLVFQFSLPPNLPLSLSCLPSAPPHLPSAPPRLPSTPPPAFLLPHPHLPCVDLCRLC